MLVCGGGIAGIQASLDLSAAGFHVYLVEQSPTIGGGMARLDKTFPTGDCATCIISPKLVECMRDLNIEVLTMSDVVRLDGEAGRFQATVQQRPRSVDADKCTGCGDCWTACPVRNRPESTPRVRAAARPLERGGRKPSSTRYSLATRAIPGATMPVLQEINQAYRHLPRAVLEHVASRRGSATARAAARRELLRPVPAAAGRTPRRGGVLGNVLPLPRIESPAGAARRRSSAFRPGETDKTGRFTLRTVRCLGLCALSPAMKIDGQSFGRVNLDKIPEILEQFE